MTESDCEKTFLNQFIGLFLLLVLMLTSRNYTDNNLTKYKVLDKKECVLKIQGVKKGVKIFAEIAAGLDFKGLQDRGWWPQLDSNQRPIDYESSALTN